jgi:hypothetical protein
MTTGRRGGEVARQPETGVTGHAIVQGDPGGHPHFGSLKPCDHNSLLPKPMKDGRIQIGRPASTGISLTTYAYYSTKIISTWIRACVTTTPPPIDLSISPSPLKLNFLLRPDAALNMRSLLPKL